MDRIGIGRGGLYSASAAAPRGLRGFMPARAAPLRLRLPVVGPQLRSPLPSQRPRSPALRGSLRSLWPVPRRTTPQVDAHAGRAQKSRL